MFTKMLFLRNTTANVQNVVPWCKHKYGVICAAHKLNRDSCQTSVFPFSYHRCAFLSGRLLHFFPRGLLNITAKQTQLSEGSLNCTQ